MTGPGIDGSEHSPPATKEEAELRMEESWAGQDQVPDEAEALAEGNVRTGGEAGGGTRSCRGGGAFSGSIWRPTLPPANDVVFP